MGGKNENDTGHHQVLRVLRVLKVLRPMLN